MTIGKEMHGHQDGKFHAAVAGAVAPGTSEPIAMIGFDQPPNRIRYRVRAIGASFEGTLDRTDERFVEVPT